MTRKELTLKFRKNLISEIEEKYLFRKESFEAYNIMRGIDLQMCTTGKLIALNAELSSLPVIHPNSFRHD